MMKFTPFRIGIAFALLLTIFTNSANATLIVNIERLSDTTARLTGSGTLSGATPSNGHILYFDDLFSSLLTGLVNENVLSSSTMTLGGEAFNFSYSISSGYGWSGSSSGIYGGTYGGDFSDGDSFSAGYIDFSIAGITSSPIFASNGSTGDIHWGTNNNIVGTWMMGDVASVPEPTILALVGIGLVGIGFMRKKA